MSAIQAVQDATVSNFATQKAGAQFDPTIILVIAEMVLSLLEALKSCRDPQGATEIANDPTWLQRRYVSLRVRREIGRNAFRSDGEEIVEAILKTGKDLDQNLMEQVYAEL